MSKLGDEVDAAATLIAPEVAVPLKTVKYVLWGVGILLVAIVAGWVIWKLFFAERAAQAKHDQVQTKATVGTAQAGQKAGQDAVKIIVDNSKGAVAVDAAVRSAINAISKAKGADQHIDPVLDDLGRQSICLRSSAAGIPDCQHLQRTDP